MYKNSERAVFYLYFSSSLLFSPFLTCCYKRATNIIGGIKVQKSMHVLGSNLL